MGTERGGCSRLMKTPRHNGGAVHSRSKNKEKGTCWGNEVGKFEEVNE